MIQTLVDEQVSWLNAFQLDYSYLLLALPSKLLLRIFLHEGCQSSPRAPRSSPSLHVANATCRRNEAIRLVCLHIQL